mgnify:CR=1 FL=1
MSRPITLCTAQWADLPLEEICKVAKKMGYEGLELATWAPSTPCAPRSKVYSNEKGSLRETSS